MPIAPADVETALLSENYLLRLDIQIKRGQPQRTSAGGRLSAGIAAAIVAQPNVVK